MLCASTCAWRFRFLLQSSLTDHFSDAFQEFLKDYKTSPEQTITTALGNITIGEDELSDEDDFMDGDGQAEERQQERARKRTPQYIYKDMLQKLADRTLDEATIDLDDLALVRVGSFFLLKSAAPNYLSVGESAGRKPETCGFH